MEESQRLREFLLNMLKWFHSFCSEHDLKYYVVEGTCLGAVRHQGFIPWDDDVDIGMPRADYQRFQALMKERPHPRYILEMPQDMAWDYYYVFSKLYDTQTTLIENTRCKIRRGIYIDIFPIDGLGNSQQEAQRNYGKIKWKLNFLLARVTGLRAGRSWIKNLAVIVARMIPFVKDKQLQLRIDNACAEKSICDYSWGGVLVGGWREKEIMPSAVLGTPVEYQFEDLVVWGPQDYDAYLTTVYGNWRELPPEEKRVTHHDYLYRDLDHSYL